PDRREVIHAGHDGLVPVAAPKRGHNAILDVYEWATGQAVRRLTAQGCDIQGASFSPTGRLLAARTAQGPILIWDILSGQELARLPGHRGGTTLLAWSPDGRRLVSAGGDLTLLVWDAGPWYAKA